MKIVKLHEKLPSYKKIDIISPQFFYSDGNETYFVVAVQLEFRKGNKEIYYVQVDRPIVSLD
jgi:hypothetical protein